MVMVAIPSIPLHVSLQYTGFDIFANLLLAGCPWLPCAYSRAREARTRGFEGVAEARLKALIWPAEVCCYPWRIREKHLTDRARREFCRF